MLFTSLCGGHNKLNAYRCVLREQKKVQIKGNCISWLKRTCIGKWPWFKICTITSRFLLFFSPLALSLSSKAFKFIFLSQTVHCDIHSTCGLNVFIKNISCIITNEPMYFIKYPCSCCAQFCSACSSKQDILPW